MSQSNDKQAVELASLLKDLWAIVSLVSIAFGPGATLFIPVVDDYSVTCSIWAVSLSFFALILIFFEYRELRRRIMCWYAAFPLTLFIGSGALYAYLLDQLPRTRYPLDLPFFTEYLVSVSYGMIFGFLSATVGILAACRLTQK